MTTTVNTSLPMWLAGCTYDANGGNDLRNSGITALVYDSGIVTGSTIGVLGGVIGGAGLVVNPGTGMTVTVQPGSFVVPNSGTPTAGGYTATLVSQATLTVQTADPANPRIDIVVANVVDNGNNTSFGQVQIITGVAAPSPTAPASPANSITLCTVTVPAAASAITSGMLADVRPFTTTTGGVLVAPVGSVTGYTGQIGYDKASGRFYHNNNASSATQMRVLPWQPAIAKVTSTVNVPGDTAEHSLISQTITTDGYTDIMCSFKCSGFASTTISSSKIRPLLRLYIDSGLVDYFYASEVFCDNTWQGGVSWSYYTSSATADTPSAGTHTVKVTVQNTLSSVAYQVPGSSSSSILLRVQPAPM